MWHALVIALVSGGLFAALFELFGVELLAVAGAPAAVAEAASGYATILFGGAALLWLTALASALFRGMGNMKLPAALMVAGAAVQVPLAGGLILGWFGLPRLGLPGAAVAVVAVAAVNGAILLWHLARGTGARLALRSLRLRRKGFEDILGPGALASLSPVFTVLTIMLVNALVSGFGMAALAGYGIVARLEFLLVPMVFGIGAAMTAVVGVNVGAGNVARAEQVAWVGAACAAAVTGAVGLLLALAPGLWLDLFTADAAIRGAGQAYLHIVGPVFAFQGLGLSLYFASQGAGSVGWPVTATVLRFVIGVGGAAAGVYLLGLGLRGVYASLAAGMLVYGLVTAAAIRWGAWRGGNADRSGGRRR